MSNQNNNKQQDFETLWAKKFNTLCHAVFLSNQHGAELLRHLELKYFRQPVAIPGQHESWAFFNEGKCEMIRSFTMAIQQHINESEQHVEVKKKDLTSAKG